MSFWVYILRSESNGAYYVGQTCNVARRVAYHNRGLSRLTRGRGPWCLVYQGEFRTRSAATAREREIKGWKSRQALERLIGGYGK